MEKIMKILIVEDNEDSRYLLMKQLRAHGREVIAANNGAEALEHALQHFPDIIVSDIMMPVMDGFQLCRECKQDERLKAIPFVFYTATYLSNEDEKFAMSLGPHAFIRKPADIEEMVRILDDILEKARTPDVRGPAIVPADHGQYLSEYNKVLIAKLEQKVIELEQEITERKKTVEALQEKTEEVDTFFNTALDLLCIADTDGHFRRLNPQWEVTLGYSLSDLEGRRFIDFVHPDDKKATLQQISHLQSQGFILNFINRYRCRDGTYRWIEWRSILHGKLLYAAARDITENRKAEEEIKESGRKLIAAMGAIIESISATIEIRDPYTAGHQRRVADLAFAIAHELNLPEPASRGLRLGCMVHDIGKMYIPAEILSKPGKLNEIEFSMIKVHPQAGYDILKHIDFPWPIAQMVLQHHERLDGSGYPQGLSGDKIIMEARILSVADVVEAMSSHRPYRPSRGIDLALEEIAKNKGVLYDPVVAETCIRLFKEKSFVFEDRQNTVN
jgi:PAS domain S-box-containing protein